MSIRVLLVEDHKMVRLGLSLVFDNVEDIELVGEAETGKAGVQMASKLNRRRFARNGWYPSH